MYFFQPCPNFAFFIFYLLMFLMLLSFYTQIFLIAPFLICNYPLFFSPFFINLSFALPSSYSLFFLSSFQSPSFHSSILEGFSFLHHPPVLDCLPLLPSTLCLLILLLSFIPWLVYNSGITFYFRWRISLTIIGWLVWMRKASRSGKRPPSAFFSFTIQCF